MQRGVLTAQACSFDFGSVLEAPARRRSPPPVCAAATGAPPLAFPPPAASAQHAFHILVKYRRTMLFQRRCTEPNSAARPGPQTLCAF